MIIGKLTSSLHTTDLKVLILLLRCHHCWLTLARPGRFFIRQRHSVGLSHRSQPANHVQEAQLSLTNYPTLLPSVESLQFTGRILLMTTYWPDFPLPLWALFHSTPSMTRIILSYPVHIWYGKTRMAGLQSGKVAWWLTQLFGHNTSTWHTATFRDRPTATSP